MSVKRLTTRIGRPKIKKITVLKKLTMNSLPQLDLAILSILNLSAFRKTRGIIMI